MEILAAVSVATGRRLGEIGFLLGAIGAVLLVVEAMSSASGTARRPSMPMTLGSVLIAVAFLLGIAAFHWG
jgi:hypothetical protein